MSALWLLAVIATAYRCPSGQLIIGYGRCINADESDAGITEAEALLENDLVRFEAAARRRHDMESFIKRLAFSR